MAPPAEGATSYDVIRSSDFLDFVGGDAQCVASGVTGTQVDEPTTLSVGSYFNYLVRAHDGSGPGPLGPDWHGDDRTAATCQ